MSATTYNWQQKGWPKATKVSKPTATRDLNSLVKLSVFTSSGAGKHTVYSLCTIYAPYAPSAVRPDKTPINKRLLSSHDPIKSPDETINDTINETINETIKSNPGIGLLRLASLIGKSRATIARVVAALIAAGKIEHRGSKKTGGYWVREGKDIA